MIRHAPVTIIKEEETSPSKAQIDAYRKQYQEKLK
jgi:hypothetical protein